MPNLPLSRNTTYSPGTQVKSVDLNDIQDQIIALHSDANLSENVSLHYGRTESANWSIGSSGRWSALGAGTVQVPLPVHESRTLTAVRMVYLRGGGTVTLKVYSVDASGVNTEEATFADNSTATEQTKDFVLSKSTVNTTFYVMLQTDAGGGGSQLRSVRFGY